VVLAGLPGSGKSTVAEGLRSRTGCVVLESDAIRALLFKRPDYSADESRRLFAAIHEAIAALLADGASAVLDATNVAESERAPLYEIAERAGARLILLQVTAPDREVRRRLGLREANGGGASTANEIVYERMRSRVEAMQRPHRLVDTSKETGPVLDAVAKEMRAT
jgi:predicted kinase